MARAKVLEDVIALSKRRGFVLQAPWVLRSFIYGPLGTELKRNLISRWWDSSVTASSSVYPVESAAMRCHAARLSNYDNNGSSGAEAEGAIHGPDPSSSGDAVNGSDGIKLSQQHTAAGQQEDNMEINTNTNTNKDTTSSDGSVINGGYYSYSPFEVVARTRTRSGASGRSSRETSTASAESSGADQKAAGAECTSPGDGDGGPDRALAFREALLFGEGSDAEWPSSLWHSNISGTSLPFGYAEIGKVYRDITSAPIQQHEQFLFKMPEFEQMALQWLCLPSEEKNWYSHWQKKRLRWWKRLARHPEDFSLQESSNGRSTLEYTFPWGSGEIESIRARNIKPPEESTVAEASMLLLKAGVDRGLLALLCDAYSERKPPSSSISRIVLKLHVSLAPFKVAILPKQDDDKLWIYCKMLADELRSAGIRTAYSQEGTLDYRLSVQDEIGTPYRVIVDERTLEAGIVSLQDRDTTSEEDMNGQDVLHAAQKMLFGAKMVLSQ